MSSAESCRALPEITRFRGGVQGRLGGVEGPIVPCVARKVSSGLGERMRALPFADFLLSVGESGAANGAIYATNQSDCELVHMR